MRTATSLLPLLLLAAPLTAQDDCDCWDPWLEQRPTGGFLGGGLALATTQGEFSDYVDGGAGFDLAYLHRLDRDGWLAIRIEGGMLIYGYETQRVPLSNTIGGRILVDLNTSNSIAFVGVGPQIGVPDGRLKPYVNGYVGYSYLWTASSVRGRWGDEPFAETTNFDDWTFSYGGGGGVYVPLRRGPAPISLDLGVRYQNNGQAEYLRPGDIEDNGDGTITVYPVRSDTDLLTFRIGVSIGITR
jgi:hypothetical protein